MLIPKKIRPNFFPNKNQLSTTNNMIEGTLICCKETKFEVFVYGKPSKKLFSSPYLSCVDGKLALDVYCKSCGKCIHVFNSLVDGYDQYNNLEKHEEILPMIPFLCVKCGNNNYCLNIKYEYTELEDDDCVLEKEECYTWIWGTLICNCCGKRYRNFIDCETG